VGRLSRLSLNGTSRIVVLSLHNADFPELPPTPGGRRGAQSKFKIFVTAILARKRAVF
jgi:hypothetical protein